MQSSERYWFCPACNKVIGESREFCFCGYRRNESDLIQEPASANNIDKNDEVRYLHETFFENEGDEWVCSECTTTVDYECKICPTCGADISEIDNSEDVMHSKDEEDRKRADKIGKLKEEAQKRRDEEKRLMDEAIGKHRLEGQLASMRTNNQASASLKNYYLKLGVSSTTTKEEIRKAYKDLLYVWDPNRFGDNPMLQNKAQSMISELDEAYEKILSIHCVAPAMPSLALQSQDIKTEHGLANRDVIAFSNNRNVNFVLSKATFAGCGKRLLAAMIDDVIFGIITFIAGFLLGYFFATSHQEVPNHIVVLVAIAIGWLYYSLCESSSKQATLGKLVLNIKVTDIYGDRLSFGRATVRHFGKFISAIILGVGFLMIVFDEKKQGLHDKIAGSIVVVK